MTTEELILQRLETMQTLLTDELAKMQAKFDDIDKYLDRHTHRQKILADRADAQDKKIAELTEIVNRLAANSDNVIWQSKNKNAVGLNPSKVYDEFDRIGVPRIEGLRLLDAANRLLIDCDSKGNIHRTKKGESFTVKNRQRGRDRCRVKGANNERLQRLRQRPDMP